jgi:uncharacterized membrane protein
MRPGRERQSITSALVALGFAGACSGSVVDDEALRASSENGTPGARNANSPASEPDYAGGSGTQTQDEPPQAAYALPQPGVATAAGSGGDSGGDSDSGDAGPNGGGAGGAPPAWCEDADPTPVPMSCGVSSTTTAYQQTQLGLLSGVSRSGSSISEPLAFNNHGLVVGRASLCDALSAFIYRDGEMVALETPPDQFNRGSSATAINDAGDVLGISGGRPFVSRDGIATPLSGFTEYDSVQPVDINNVGQVLGFAREGAFVWDAGEITYLGDSLDVAAINDQGQVAGSLPLGGAFVWEDGVMSMLPDLPGGTYTSARDINEAGQVVGESYVDDRGRAVLWENGVAYDITPPLNGALERAVAIDINDQGVVLGYLQEQGPHLNGLGFLFDHGVFTRIMPEAPFTAVSPVALNNVGHVLGRPLLFNGTPGQATIWSQGCFDTCCG